MRGIDHGLTEGRTTSRDGQHDETGGESGEPREDGPHQCAGHRKWHTLGAIGDLGDGHLQGKGGHTRQPDEAEHGAEVETEMIADLG